jgi:hypothetical protein
LVTADATTRSTARPRSALQRLGNAEIRVGVSPLIKFRELDQKVDVASVGVEPHGRGRAEQLQPPHTVTAAELIYKDKAVDARQVGRDLGVRYVLEGSLETDPERVRVAVQLIDAGTGAQVWSERWDRPLGQVFTVRDELVGQIAGTLVGFGGPVVSEVIEHARRKPPQNLDAYDYIQLARAAYRPDKEGLAEVRALHEKAIALDPNYPHAYYNLAWAHLEEALNGYSDDPARSLEQFHAAAEKMVALDPMDPYAQFIAGLSYFKRGERARGKEAWERALALAPNDPGLLPGRRYQYALRDGDRAGCGGGPNDQAGAAA